MKETIPPGVFIGIIVVVVVLLAFLGFKFLGPHRDSGTSAQDMQKRITEHGGGYSKSGTPSTGGQRMGSPGSYGGMSGAGGYPRSGGYPSSGGR